MKKDLSSAYAARKKVGLTSLKTKLKSNESANSIVQGILAKKKKALEPEDELDWVEEDEGYEEQVIEDNKDRIKSALEKLGL